MSSKLNWSAWVQLLREDLEWLRAQPRTLERDHVIGILEDIRDADNKRGRAYYDAIPAPWPPA